MFLYENSGERVSLAFSHARKGAVMTPRNDLRAAAAEGRKIVAGWCAIPHLMTAELVARQPFDAVIVDLQHGFMDYEGALSLLPVIEGQGHAALCRVPWNEPGIVMKVLDAGFSGVICPMVSNADDARRFAAACRYAPAGIRSWGPTRAQLVHGADYATRANGLVTAWAMVESREALERLDEILAVEGIDGIYVGPADLGLSLGAGPVAEPVSPVVVDALAEILAKTKAAGRLAGIHCGSPAMVRAMHAAGFDLATLMSDTRIFALAMAQAVREARADAVGLASAGNVY